MRPNAEHRAVLGTRSENSSPQLSSRDSISEPLQKPRFAKPFIVCTCCHGSDDAHCRMTSHLRNVRTEQIMCLAAGIL